MRFTWLVVDLTSRQSTSPPRHCDWRGRKRSKQVSGCVGCSRMCWHYRAWSRSTLSTIAGAITKYGPSTSRLTSKRSAACHAPALYFFSWLGMRTRCYSTLALRESQKKSFELIFRLCLTLNGCEKADSKSLDLEHLAPWPGRLS